MSLQFLQVPGGMSGVFFWASLISLAVLLFILAFRNNQRFADWVSKSWESFKSFINPPRHMARLNKVVCYYCEKGRGIYNPVYRMLDGVPHVEGTCNHCNRHITVRLRG